MSVTKATQLLSPEEIAVRSGQQMPYLHLPVRAELFATRETRLRELAAGHAMRDFLLFAAELAHVQHEVLQDYPEVALPSGDDLVAAGRAAQAPLPAPLWPRDPAWRAAFRRMLELLVPRLAGSPAQAAVQALLAASDDHLEGQAELLLQGAAGLDMSAAPLVAAGLQVYWTHMVLAVQQAHGAARQEPFGRTLDVTLCPCCGSLPTSSITRLDASGSNFRYLNCALCSTQWHMVRVKCSHCQSTKGIHYHSLQAVATDGAQEDTAQASVQAETCDECGHYLKIVRMERDLHVDPVADDVATLTLDILVSEAGYQPHGVNLLLLTGGEEEPSDDDGPSSQSRSN
ncbi:formate dehydrogenase accessory protein FdhE [Massilia timonae]|jgi:FdhE protein|uniref:formate dehydrogenase accessory protein FdhE n=1 Tax=Massilia timonae TaxID=47229 RepID=UPI0023530079|nr:formate dehydrogenase accessory protein FdhE [Massilia timonae]